MLYKRDTLEQNAVSRSNTAVVPLDFTAAEKWPPAARRRRRKWHTDFGHCIRHRAGCVYQYSMTAVPAPRKRVGSVDKRSDVASLLAVSVILSGTKSRDVRFCLACKLITYRQSKILIVINIIFCLEWGASVTARRR